MHQFKLLLLSLSTFAIFLVLPIVQSQAVAQTSWDNQAEFSLNNNPNGPWTYGCQNSKGEFSPYNNTFNLGDGIVGWDMNDDPDSCGNITINTSKKPIEKYDIVWEPGQICLHPGLFGYKVVLRWTSPVTMAIYLNIGIAAKSENGVPANVEVLYKGASVTKAVIDGFDGVGGKQPRFGAQPERSLNSSLQVSKGDVIDIVVSSVKKPIAGHIALSFSITPSERRASKSIDSTNVEKRG